MKPGNLLILTYWSFDNALIQTYTLPYLLQIRKIIPAQNKIYLFTFSQNQSFNPSTLAQISRLKEQNIFLIEFRYQKFGVWMMFKLLFVFAYLIYLCVAKNIKYLHGWCTPGGALGYLLSVVTGKTLILDSFEPHAETMAESGTWSRSGLAYKVLFALEKRQLKKAKEVICAARGMIRHSQEIYGITKNRYFVKPACVDLKLFDPLVPSKHTEFNLRSNVCVYAGKFGGIYLEQEVFDFFKAAHDHWKGDFTVLLLTSHSNQEIETYCTASGFPPSALIKLFVSHQEVPAYMKLGTFGFCPVKPLPSKEFCTPIKNGEYWAMGLPVVITNNISSDSALIEQHKIGYVLKHLRAEEYSNALHALDALKKDPQLTERIRKIAVETRSFEISNAIYRTIYG